MLFQQFVDTDLGHVSCIFGDDESKEVVVVDPRRDIDEYVEFIEQNGLRLKYILNTHIHADYIGGHLELLDKYRDAQNIFHQDVPAGFDFIKAKEDDSFTLGKNITLKILETPGHTPYCISYIVNENGIYKYIFTGDILFVGDIARPDLLGEENLEQLSKLSYETAKKLWSLSDELIMFTSHIKGSLCGKDLKSQFFSTIGIEKKTNKSFSLSQKSEEEYIDNLLNQNLETPIFFKKMASINIAGPKLLKELKEPKILKKDSFFKELDKEDFIIDFRHPNCFKSGHIKRSLNVYEYSNIILIIGSLLDNESRLFLAGGKKTNFEVILKKLRGIGFHNIVAILKDDVNELDNLIRFEDNNNLSKKIINLERDKNMGDINIEISELKNLKFDKNFKYEAICTNGYKSMAVTSYINVILDRGLNNE